MGACVEMRKWFPVPKVYRKKHKGETHITLEGCYPGMDNRFSLALTLSAKYKKASTTLKDVFLAS